MILERGQGRAARRARRPLEVKDSVCQRMPFGFLGVTTLLSSPKVKRASRSLLRQVPKVSIPFETGIEIEEIRSPFSGSSLGPPFGTLLGSLFGSFLGSIWEPLGALWTPLVPFGGTFEAFGTLRGLLHDF